MATWSESKAAVVTSFDEPPHYQEFVVPRPTSDSQILVDVLAVGLHPRTRTGAAGTHYTSTGTLPMIPGIDGVGRRSDGKKIYFVSDDDVLGSMAEGPWSTSGARSNCPMTLMWPRSRLPSTPPCRRGWRCAVESPSNPVRACSSSVRPAMPGSMAVQVAKLLGAGRVVGAGRDLTRLTHSGPLAPTLWFG